MLANIFSRLLQGLLVLFVLFTVTFFLIKALPGGPFKSTERAIPEHIRAKIEAYYGLDKPTAVQYVIQLKNYIINQDLGTSLRLEGRQVSEIIGQAFPVSCMLGVVAMMVAIVIGIPLGVIAAWKKNSWMDYSAMAVAMIGICIPSFVVGPVLADQFGRRMSLLPAMGWDATHPTSWILPSITLGLATAAYLSRLTRAGMLDILNQDFTRTARAKGVDSFRLLVRHCLRGGLIPAVAFIGPAFAAIISGSVVIESIFAMPGLGLHFIKAIQVGDAPVILGIVLLYGLLIITANFITDLLGMWLNPRLRGNR
ncbi:ABC transporter permease [Luteolibacter pohnpeiensis]|uniref:ABC transporter permease n=1 Tax=Luteolibacter pohnpeiensis TaxID=454153 RepID=A0A934SBM0_9BACT|nr:ABC transporter permease [Luteolibacter pohnpeiensis]MBK1882924.1 ABC transporter permease [Luteolibacter pohnpeiensis]